MSPSQETSQPSGKSPLGGLSPSWQTSNTSPASGTPAPEQLREAVKKQKLVERKIARLEAELMKANEKIDSLEVECELQLETIRDKDGSIQELRSALDNKNPPNTTGDAQHDDFNRALLIELQNVLAFSEKLTNSQVERNERLSSVANRLQILIKQANHRSEVMTRTLQLAVASGKTDNASLIRHEQSAAEEAKLVVAVRDDVVRQVEEDNSANTKLQKANVQARSTFGAYMTRLGPDTRIAVTESSDNHSTDLAGTVVTAENMPTGEVTVRDTTHGSTAAGHASGGDATTGGTIAGGTTQGVTTYGSTPGGGAATGSAPRGGATTRGTTQRGTTHGGTPRGGATNIGRQRGGTASRYLPRGGATGRGKQRRGRGMQDHINLAYVTWEREQLERVAALQAHADRIAVPSSSKSTAQVAALNPPKKAYSHFGECSSFWKKKQLEDEKQLSIRSKVPDSKRLAGAAPGSTVEPGTSQKPTEMEVGVELPDDKVTGTFCEMVEAEQLESAEIEGSDAPSNVSKPMDSAPLPTANPALAANPIVIGASPSNRGDEAAQRVSDKTGSASATDGGDRQAAKDSPASVKGDYS